MILFSNCTCGVLSPTLSPHPSRRQDSSLSATSDIAGDKHGGLQTQGLPDQTPLNECGTGGFISASHMWLQKAAAQ